MSPPSKHRNDFSIDSGKPTQQNDVVVHEKLTNPIPGRVEGNANTKSSVENSWKLWVKLIQCVVVLFKYTITWLLTLNQKLRELQAHVAAMKASVTEITHVSQFLVTSQSPSICLNHHPAASTWDTTTDHI
jgi:hypothetical protein